MKAEEFYKQRSNSIRELWVLSPKQIEYIALIMEEYAALRQRTTAKRAADYGRFRCPKCDKVNARDKPPKTDKVGCNG